MHGTSISGQDDRDEMGLCLEPPRFVTGLARVPAGLSRPRPWSSSSSTGTVWDRPGGLANRSGAGDLDVVIYSARKWARLACPGTSMLLLLFVPDDEVVYRDDIGAELTANAHRFVSALAAERFLGYLQAQKAAMTGEVEAHPNRPELVREHGYDTKFAMHALRLGLQGVELLTTGRIQPARAGARSVVPAVGAARKVPLQVLAAITDAEVRLTALRTSSAVPAEPDRGWVDDWLRSYLSFWARL